MKGIALFHAELICVIQTVDPSLMTTLLLRTPEPRRQQLISTQISNDCNRVTAASRAVCKGALAVHCPSAIRDLDSFICSCGDLIDKICKLITIKKIITFQKDLIIWHSKLQACQWINFMTKQIWSSWLPLSRSLHQSVLSPQIAHSICMYFVVSCLWICNDNSRSLPDIFTGSKMRPY